MKTMITLTLLIFSLTSFASEAEVESEFLKGMRLGCEKQKIALGCYNYANLLINRNRQDEAKKYFKLGCDGGHEKACRQESWEVVAVAPVEAPIEKIEKLEASEAILPEEVPTPVSEPEREVANIQPLPETTLEGVTPEAEIAPTTEVALAPEEVAAPEMAAEPTEEAALLEPQPVAEPESTLLE